MVITIGRNLPVPHGGDHFWTSTSKPAYEVAPSAARTMVLVRCACACPRLTFSSAIAALLSAAAIHSERDRITNQHSGQNRQSKLESKYRWATRCSTRGQQCESVLKKRTVMLGGCPARHYGILPPGAQKRDARAEKLWVSRLRQCRPRSDERSAQRSEEIDNGGERESRCEEERADAVESSEGATLNRASAGESNL